MVYYRCGLLKWVWSMCVHCIGGDIGQECMLVHWEYEELTATMFSMARVHNSIVLS